MDEITGYYLDGKTSKRHLATLSQKNDFIVITINNDAKSLSLKFEKLNITSRLANTPREISWGDDALFVTDDNHGVDGLIKQLGASKQPNKLHVLESKLPLVFVSAGLVIVLLASFIVYGIPASANYIAHNLPVSANQQLGGSLSILDKTLFSPSQIPRNEQERIKQLAAPFLKQFPKLNAQLFFRSGMPANALVLPGGQIVFTDDFVTLADNDDELLAILFHEIGHLKHKHTTRRVLQGSMITLLVILITGDVDTVDILTGLPTLILDLAYSREFENEADDFAFALMAKNNISISHFSSMMTKLDDVYTKKAGKNTDKESSFTSPSFLSTHPATKERIKKANLYFLNH